VLEGSKRIEYLTNATGPTLCRLDRASLSSRGCVRLGETIILYFK
jgi:hypothetical protein